MENQQLPLNGIRVLEFTHAVMGPTCGLVLADLGAEVIKIEPAPGGDPTRKLLGFGTGFFTFFNRNKKSLAVNAKTNAGRKIIDELLKTADVLIENFAPGTMERLGFGSDKVAEINPKLIYCSLKGFMPGPYDTRVALDEVVQMMSGLAYMTGPPGRPLRAGASIVDIMGGTFGALGVLVALRERDKTGKGQLVQNGLFETAAFIMGQHMAYSAISQEPVLPMPGRVSAWAVYRVFETKDEDSIFVGITSDKHWGRFCDSFEREDLRNDETLATNNQRIVAHDRLLPDLEKMFRKMNKDDILERCAQAGIPFAPIAHPEDLFEDPHLKKGGSLVSTNLPDGSTSFLPLMPLMLDRKWMGLRTQPPTVGETTQSLLAEMGYSKDDIDELQQAGYISV